MNSLRKMGLMSWRKLIPEFGYLLPVKLALVAFLKLFIPIKYINSIFDIKHKIIETQLLKILCYKDFNDDSKLDGDIDDIKLNDNKHYIWVFWWQGINCMPDIISRCYKQLILTNNDYDIVFLDKNNFHEYVELPTYILSSIGKNISITHFSDILRVNLLYKYGGVWVDSTLFFLKKIPIEYFTYNFFSIKDNINSSMSVAKHRWTTFFICSTKNSIFMEQLIYMFNTYIKKHNKFIDYLLIDYFIDIIYNNNEEFKNIIDNMPYTNYNVHCMEKLKEKANKDFIKKILDDNLFVKMTYKGLKEKSLLEYNSNYKLLIDNYYKD